MCFQKRWIAFNLDEFLIKYEYGLHMLEAELNILFHEYERKNKYTPVEHVKSRIKSTHSIINKLIDKGYEITEENITNHIHDIAGVRIVCSFLDDVYDIVKIIEESNFIVIKKKKDYIKKPKETGYSSYHLIVEVPVFLSSGKIMVEAEIQIRTVAMDFWASLDHKIQYKFSTDIPSEVIEQMYQYSLEIKKMDKRMSKLNKMVNKYKK